ncbi:hypothetical protein QMK24_25350 [Streptomyces sp. PH10-H1]|nr:hypothetical protein [Streptomyces sp. PH10-H1]
MDGRGAAADIGGEGLVACVAGHHLDAVGDRGGAGAVDHADALAAVEQGGERGRSDRAGTER